MKYIFFVLLALLLSLEPSVPVDVGSAAPAVVIIPVTGAVSAKMGSAAPAVAIIPVTGAVSAKMGILETAGTFPEPPKPKDNIPAPKYDYGCKIRAGVECVNATMSFDEQVAHVLFMEGSSDGLQLLVDMLQVVDNRTVNAWECSIDDCGVAELAALNPHKIPWSQITDEQAERLVLYLLSIPYTSRGETHPVWNGWSQPLQMAKVREIYPRKFRNYALTLQAVKEWRAKCIRYDHADGNDTCIFLRLNSGKILRPQHAVCAHNILYVYMTKNKLLPSSAPVAAYDKLDYGSSVVYVQFLSLGGYQFDKDR
jgi:hypothetical protein